MRSKEYIIERFIESVALGSIKLRINDNAQESVRDQLNEYVDTHKNPHPKLTDRAYKWLLLGRIQGWITGEIDERDMEHEVDSLRKELESVKKERDAAVETIAQAQIQPPKKDFQAMK